MKQLSDLCHRLRDLPFTVVCAPCAQFLSQEHVGSEATYRYLLHSLESSRGSFVVLKKLDVNGERMHPIYHFLKKHSSLYRANVDKVLPVAWNYGKFLVDPQGKVVQYSKPTAPPLDLESKIRALCGG